MAVEDAGTRYPQVFRRVCSAGEPLNPEAIRWFREHYGVTVLDYYGLTESYPLVANYPWMEVREGSMGRPMPGWDVQLLDEDERPVSAGERGEICLRARSNPHYPLGYWNDLEASAETFGGEWFHSKDAARQDEDGYFWYEGRADDVIISAGYRIGPFEVESVCLEHPAVREAAVVASPDDLRGSVVKAFIILSDGYRGSDELADEIKSFVRERLSACRRRRRSSDSLSAMARTLRRAGGAAACGQRDVAEVSAVQHARFEPSATAGRSQRRGAPSTCNGGRTRLAGPQLVCSISSEVGPRRTSMVGRTASSRVSVTSMRPVRAREQRARRP